MADPAIDAHLAITGASAWINAGARSTVGIIDTGVDLEKLNGLGAHDGFQFVSDPDGKDITVPDKSGHGTQVARIISGFGLDGHPGGVAQKANLLSVRFLADDNPAVQVVKPDGSFNVATQWLVDQGANVVNVSSDSLSWNTEAGRDELYTGFARLAGSDALVVVAAGDAIGHEPSQLAQLPFLDDDPSRLRDHWLVVGAVSSEVPTLISAYSNACGAARDVCLLAPGDVKTVDPNANGLVNGHSTAFAAAQVSGAAALVRDRYTYMDASLTQQVLLGTATDLGTPGVDDVYGHGLLNVAKALNGPARLDWGDVRVDLGRMTSGGWAGDWSNDISGSGNLTIDGGGFPYLMWLSGHNTYTGTTTVRNGVTLGVFDYQAGDFVVQSGAHLTAADGAEFGGDIRIEGGALHLGSAGSGWTDAVGTTVGIRGDVDNRAQMWMPKNDIAVTIGGDYVQSTGAMTGMYLGARPLQVDGIATLAGELRVVGELDGYVFNTRADVLEATRVDGRFDSVTWSAPSYLVGISAHYESDKVWLELTRNDVTTTAMQLGLSPAAIAGAQRLEEAFTDLDQSRDSVDQAFLSAAGTLQATASAEQLDRSLASLSGELHSADATFTLISLADTRHALESRMDNTLATSPRTWFETFDDTSGSADFDMESTGWMMGMDLVRGPSATLGVSMKSSQGNVWHGTRNDHERNRLLDGQWYLNWELDEGRYILGSVGFGHGQRWLRREVDLGGERHSVASRYTHEYGTLNLQAGAHLRWPRFLLAPYVGLQALHLQRDGFHEEGAAGFGLSAPGSATTAALGLAGARWNHVLSTGHARWDLQGRIEVQRLLSQSDSLQARFTGIDAWAPLSGSGLADNVGMLELGLVRWFGPDARLRVTLDARRSSQARWGTTMLEWSQAL